VPASSRDLLPVSGDFRLAYPNEIEKPSVEVTLAPAGVELGKVAVLPSSCNPDERRVFERNGCSTVTPDVRFGDNIPGPM